MCCLTKEGGSFWFPLPFLLGTAEDFQFSKIKTDIDFGNVTEFKHPSIRPRDKWRKRVKLSVSSTYSQEASHFKVVSDTLYEITKVLYSL